MAGATRARFRHEALFYGNDLDYVTRTGRFIAEAVDAGEPILVLVRAENIDRLREHLGNKASGVHFEDMEAIGFNPAHIIPAWQEFAREHGSSGGGLRGIGEPIWAERTGEVLVECQRHEALINVAFESSGDFWLLCPYDLKLGADVLEEAHRSHPFLVDAAGNHVSSVYVGARNPRLQAPLEHLGEPSVYIEFGPRDLGAVRKLVGRQAASAGLDLERIADIVFATNEVASNSIRHAGGKGRLRVWQDHGAIVCEVSDSGEPAPVLADRRKPTADVSAPRGLWLTNQLCDLVQLRSYADGNVVRLHLRDERHYSG